MFSHSSFPKKVETVSVLFSTAPPATTMPGTSFLNDPHSQKPYEAHTVVNLILQVTLLLT